MDGLKQEIMLCVLKVILWNTKVLAGTEVLQEYFVPVDEFASYIDDLREVLATEKLNLLNITVRYVEKDNKAVMSYAKDDMFALVLLINQKRPSRHG